MSTYIRCHACKESLPTREDALKHRCSGREAPTVTLSRADVEETAREEYNRMKAELAGVRLSRADVGRVLAVLVKWEWSSDPDDPWCHLGCQEDKVDGHAPDCELAAVKALLEGL